MSDDLQSTIQRLLAGNHDADDLEQIATAVRTGQLVLARGNSAVAVNGNVVNSPIVSGSNNVTGNNNLVIYGADAETIQTILRQQAPASLNGLTQQVRSRASEKVFNLFGKIQLLNKRKVDVDRLYVDVYVLKIQNHRTNISGLLKGQNSREQFERLGLGTRGERLQGLEVAESEDYPRLIVLGKPGSGKSTFLRHLAVGCAKGDFLDNYIPYLLELRDVDDTDFSLFQYIHEEFELEADEYTKQLLRQGKVLILLDGLDEVSTPFQQKIQDELRKFTKRYDRNRFVMTCRTQTTEYIPEQFSSIEVADFNPNQVESFALNWFNALSETPEQGEAIKEHFMEKLKEHPQTAELAVTPVLLSLACWIFEDSNCLPEKRSELYQEGLDLLLRQWDENRGISREAKSEIYRQLTLEERKQLLGYLALQKFEQTENFILFEELEICGYISEHLQISVNESSAVLKSIAEQHGILVERAHKIWSFSHLTFQEYLVAKWFCDGSDIQPLMEHITDYRWREVFLLSAEMLQNRADLLLEAQKLTNQLVSDNQLIQQILIWISSKSNALDLELFLCKQLETQVYSELAQNSDLAKSVQENESITIELTLPAPDKSLYTPNPKQQALLRGFCLDLIYIYSFENSLIGNPKIIDQLNLYRSFKRKNKVIESIIIFDHSLNWFFADLTKFSAPHFVFEHYSYSSLTKALAQCSEQFPVLLLMNIVSLMLIDRLLILWHSLLSIKDTSSETLKKWWNDEGERLADQLIEALRKERDICHDWALTEDSKELMKKYYVANRLLIDCINDIPTTENSLAEKLVSEILLPGPNNIARSDADHFEQASHYLT